MTFIQDRAGRRGAKIFILIFVLLTAGIVAGGSHYYRRIKLNSRAEVERQLNAIADLKVNELARYREDRRADGAIFYRNAAFSALVSRYFEHPDDSEARDQLRGWLAHVQEACHYERVMLLDQQFSKKMIVPEGPERSPSFVSPSSLEGLRSRKIVFEDFYWNEANQRIYLKILIPIIQEASNDRFIGILALRIDPKTYLYPYISRWPAPSLTAETLIIRRDGTDALFLNELKFQKDSALRLRIPLRSKDVPAVKAALGQEGIVEGMDYRGVPVVAAVRSIPDSPWFLVAKMDTSEVFGPMRARLWEIAGIIAVLLLGTGAAVGYFWRRQSALFYQGRYLAAEELRENEEQFRAMSAAAQDAIVMMDNDGLITFWSEAAERIFGYSRNEAVGKDAHALLSPAAFREKYQEAFPHWRETGQGAAVGRTIELTALRKDGTEVPIEMSLSSAQLKGRWNAIAVIRDITERKRAIEESREANEKLSSMVEVLKERNFQNSVLSEMREFLQASSTMEEIGPVILRSMKKLFPDSEGSLFLLSASKTDLEAAVRWGDFPEDVDDNVFSPDACWGLRRGSVYVVEDIKSGLICPHLRRPPAAAYACLPLMAKGDVLGLLHIRGRSTGKAEDSLRLISEVKDLTTALSEMLSLSISNIRLRETLSIQSIKDPLTGLFNRRYMEENFQREIYRAARKQEHIGVIMADIDHFKEFNDMYGHAAGDFVLVELANFFKLRIRGADIACRYGGEEFAFILPESSLENTEHRASQMIEEARTLRVEYGGQALGPTTLSMGVAAYPTHGAKPDELLRAADAALYRAKKEGRNRVVTA
jgi:diguanylate cyclase (GGDEF)-like protein/PAS domain S-box-containing protein